MSACFLERNAVTVAFCRRSSRIQSKANQIVISQLMQSCDVDSESCYFRCSACCCLSADPLGETHSVTLHVEAPPTLHPTTTSLYEVNIYHIVNDILLSFPTRQRRTAAARPFFLSFSLSTLSKEKFLYLCIYYLDCFKLGMRQSLV